MISSQQQSLLQSYKEKSFVAAILAEEAYNYYCFIKNVINIPLIICNSAMVCINAIITDNELLKILNIILNSSTGLILSLISNFKIYENISLFGKIRTKYTKLNHLIDTKMANELDVIDNDFILQIINDYDNITIECDSIYPIHIKARIRNQYKDKMSLPSSLTAEIVECKNNCCNCVSVI